ncbi:hypothetical protein BC834DRAFT_74815 [Gloeopeniophorella convolvens]|nr:hypothetical protein BC834DRAFT_74815 [Gloeopeniophorella convolvens]
MSAPPKDVLAYTASCNPPRRAKRPVTSPAAVTDRAAHPLPPLAPAIVVLSPDPASAGDDEEFAAEAPQPKRRGRKPSTLSRAARESMRRQNHSRIEKARRTKINEALTLLRDLVPVDAGRKPGPPPDETADEDDGDDDDDFGSGKKPGKGKQKQEKEFKLEILEKAVAYVQELQEKVRELEAKGCVKCAEASALRRPKRKREATPSPSDEHDLHSAENYTVERPAKRPGSIQPNSPPLPPSSSTRLPSISSWLPTTAIDAIRLPDARTPSVPPIQLLTPPSSAVIGPMVSPQVPPMLHLELPMASMSTVNHPPKFASASPSWTPEDESVASLLLQIKTSNSPKGSKRGSSVDDILGSAPEISNSGLRAESRPMSGERRVQTPGSLLGMTIGSK